MRIRRKKHLFERLDAVKDYIVPLAKEIPNVKEAVKDKHYIDFNTLFGNSNPVELEIGSGKGGFIVQKAMENPNVNYIAVELLQNVMVMAVEHAKREGLNNLRFINTGAEYLPRYLPSNSVQNIYLNFSTPYPPNSYESHRLTCDRFLVDYKDYLVNGGVIFQKTDDKDFYDYSFWKFKENGYEVKDVSNDINDGVLYNIETEYEKKFRAIGKPIYALTAKNVK